MIKNTIVHSDREVTLAAAPINPAWVLEGAPTARNAILSSSEDSTAFTMMWDCTAGKFNWHYSFDETLYILEGSVVVSSQNTPAKRLEAGDIVFFPSGTTAHWHVENYIRKVAFCRRVVPKPIAFGIRLAHAARGVLRRAGPFSTNGSLAVFQGSMVRRDCSTSLSLQYGR